MRTTTFDAHAAKLLKPGAYLTFQEHPGLRLTASQWRRAWIYRYKHPTTGQMKQSKLGQWPALGFGQAVERWEEARDQRNKGIDLGHEKREAKHATRRAHEVKQRKETSTCGRLVEWYLTEIVEPKRKLKGAKEVRRMLEGAIEKEREFPAEDISIEQAHAIVLRVAKRAPRVAHMTRQELRACWECAIGVGRIKGSNPFAGKKIGGEFKITRRKVTLNDHEAGLLLRWMREPGAYSRTVADVLELILRTGLRPGEVCGIHSNELEEREGVAWLDIPIERMKTGKKMDAPHRVPLVGRAREIVVARVPDSGGYLFASRGGDRPILEKVIGIETYSRSGRSDSKVYKGRKICPVVYPRKWPSVAWTPHDLRRTARTFLGEMNCPFEVGEAILAHALPGVASTYNQAQYDQQKVEWLTKLGDHLDKLAAAHNVVALGRKRTA
jgi:integrase